MTRDDRHATTDQRIENDMDPAPTASQTPANSPVEPEDESAGLAARFARCVTHDSTPRDIENQKRFLAWMVAWAALGILDPEWFGFVEDETSWFTLLQSGLVVAALAGAIVAFIRYVRETDELNRRLQLTGLSIGFGAGFFAGEAGEAALHAGLISSVHEQLPLMAMLLSYVAASALLARHYQ